MLERSSIVPDLNHTLYERRLEELKGDHYSVDRSKKMPERLLLSVILLGLSLLEGGIGSVPVKAANELTSATSVMPEVSPVPTTIPSSAGRSGGGGGTMLWFDGEHIAPVR